MSTPKLLIPCLLLAAAIPSLASADPTSSGDQLAGSRRPAEVEGPREPTQSDATHAPVAASSTASRLAALRDGVREIDSRSKAVRALMEKATPQLRRHSKRILVSVEQDQMSLVARLEILRTVSSALDEQTVKSMEATYGDAVKLLARVESWYTPPRRPS